MPTLQLEHVVVEFPFLPYPQQEDLMSTIIAALQQQQNALLESPTGTGKTLCLLCSILAWKKTYKDWRKASRNPELAQDTELLRNLHFKAFGPNVPYQSNREKDLPMPKIYYASVAHAHVENSFAIIAIGIGDQEHEISVTLTHQTCSFCTR
jgi:regulator of telomere elongation helicase 1